MRNIVFDAGALTLIFQRDPRIRRDFDAVITGETHGHIAAVNLAEYYHKTCRILGKETADTRFFSITSSPISVPDDTTLARLAGIEKCRNRPELSLADCYALALTKKEHGVLFTTDRALSGVDEVETRFLPYP